MSTRYLTNTALMLSGGLLLVTSQAFAVSTFSWVMRVVHSLELHESAPSGSEHEPAGIG
jgi:hypothetical protein